MTELALCPAKILSTDGSRRRQGEGLQRGFDEVVEV